MMRTTNLWKLAKEYGLKFITIKELQDYCRVHEKHVVQEACADMPTQYGHFKIYGYVNDITGEHHVALVKGDIGDGEDVLAACIPSASPEMCSVPCAVTAENSSRPRCARWRRKAVASSSTCARKAAASV